MLHNFSSVIIDFVHKFNSFFFLLSPNIESLFPLLVILLFQLIIKLLLTFFELFDCFIHILDKFLLLDNMQFLGFKKFNFFILPFTFCHNHLPFFLSGSPFAPFSCLLTFITIFIVLLSFVKLYCLKLSIY